MARGTVKTVLMAAAVSALVAWAQPVRAEGFVSPFVGYNFGGDSGCPHITNCDDKRLNVGVSVGAMGGFLGFEEEFAYAKDFFGTAAGLDSSVLSLMSNLMVVPDLGPFRPYALVGIGLVRTHASFSSSGLFSSDNNNLGWDVGGGLIVSVAPHVGLRGDVRYIHSFQDLNALGFALGDQKLDFGRASGAVVFTF